MINHSRIIIKKAHVRYMCTPRRLPANLKSWPGIAVSRNPRFQQKILTNTVAATTVANKNNTDQLLKNDKIYGDKWIEGFIPEGKSEK